MPRTVLKLLVDSSKTKSMVLPLLHAMHVERRVHRMCLIYLVQLKSEVTHTCIACLGPLPRIW